MSESKNPVGRKPKPDRAELLRGRIRDLELLEESLVISFDATDDAAAHRKIRTSLRELRSSLQKNRTALGRLEWVTSNRPVTPELPILS